GMRFCRVRFSAEALAGFHAGRSGFGREGVAPSRENSRCIATRVRKSELRRKRSQARERKWLRLPDWLTLRCCCSLDRDLELQLDCWLCCMGRYSEKSWSRKLVPRSRLGAPADMRCFWWGQDLSHPPEPCPMANGNTFAKRIATSRIRSLPYRQERFW